MSRKSKKITVTLSDQVLESVLELRASYELSMSKTLRVLIIQGIYLRKLLGSKNIKLRSELLMLLIFDNENLELTKKFITEIDEECIL